MHGCTVMGVRELLPPQRLDVEALLDGKDVLVCLLTGYGKYSIFQILPSICSFWRSHCISNSTDSCCIASDCFDEESMFCICTESR